MVFLTLADGSSELAEIGHFRSSEQTIMYI
jgi:hypothetical protein